MQLLRLATGHIGVTSLQSSLSQQCLDEQLKKVIAFDLEVNEGRIPSDIDSMHRRLAIVGVPVDH